MYVDLWKWKLRLRMSYNAPYVLVRYGATTGVATCERAYTVKRTMDLLP